MKPFMVIYQMEDETKSVTFENSENGVEFTNYLRDMGYPHEWYTYTDHYGYIRTRRWPAQI